MKKIAKLMLVGLFAIGVTAGCGCKKKETNTTDESTESTVEANTNEDVIKDQEVDVFKFENTSLIYENGNSFLETSVTNTSDTDQTLVEFNIHVNDSEGNEIVTLTGFIGDSLAAGETKVITSTYGDNLTKAASITYEVVR